MSAAPARAPRSSTSPSPTSVPVGKRRSTASLRAVAAPAPSASLRPIAWLSIAIVLGALLAVLLLNTSMAAGAYERRALKIEIANLEQQRAVLVTQLEDNSAPQHLAQRAQDLGMEPAETLGFVSIADAAVLQQGTR